MKLGVVLALCSACAGLRAGAQTSPHSATPQPTTSLYVSGPTIDFARLLNPPPDPASPAGKEDLAAVHRIERGRTTAAVQAAQADDVNETIFLYATVLGPSFRADKLPLTAALSAHLRHESAVVNPALKVRFARPRPYRTDPTVHLVCEPSQANAYPSGHAMVGYLLGFALTQMVPEKSDAILARAKNFAENRLVCGAHYPTDIEASHTIALALFGTLAASPKFQAELAAARTELHQQLAGATGSESVSGTGHLRASTNP